MIDLETASGLFVIGVLLVAAFAGSLHAAYRLGRRRALRDHFSATLRADDSGSHRL